ncbi:MAG: hypothetical protein WDM90_20945 [Ferruginibacter sp.]
MKRILLIIIVLPTFVLAQVKQKNVAKPVSKTKVAIKPTMQLVMALL